MLWRGVLTALTAAIAFAQAPAGLTLPYRFLLVISSQWEDPASHLIEGTGEFQTVAALLKAWGLPFEILRLDQQRFDKYHMLDREGRPRIGTIIWIAGETPLDGVDTGLLETLVKQQGVGLVVLGDSVAPLSIAALAGLRYSSEYNRPDPLSVTADHFVTRGLKERGREFIAATATSAAGDKVIVENAEVLAVRGALPFLAVRQYPGGGRVVWLGAHRRSVQVGNQWVRDLLKRCLVWAQGYALYREYPRSLILQMDDMGTSDKTYLARWHYRTPAEDEIRAGLIEPLKRHNAVLVQNVNTGFVDRKTRRVLNPWRQRVADEIDGKTVHDYASTRRGLDAGLREGVFEIQSHGWTHMLPDLDSAPGPWWTAPLDGLGSLDWYNEFGDRLRNRETPAATQRFHLERAMECIRQDFGVTPLALRPGGSLASRSYMNHTGRIAAQAGFGVMSGPGVHYLGRDLVILLAPVVPEGGWDYTRRLNSSEIPWTTDGPYWLRIHDRDLSMDPGSVARLLNELGPGVRFMSANEYCAYLHAHVERDMSAGNALSLAIAYENHYGAYFASRQSTWTLHLSDDTRRMLKTSIPEKVTVEIPAGLGRHTVRVESKAVSVK